MNNPFNAIVTRDVAEVRLRRKGVPSKNLGYRKVFTRAEIMSLLKDSSNKEGSKKKVIEGKHTQYPITRVFEGQTSEVSDDQVMTLQTVSRNNNAISKTVAKILRLLQARNVLRTGE